MKVLNKTGGHKDIRISNSVNQIEIKILQSTSENHHS